MHFSRYNENSEKEDRTLHLIGPDKKEKMLWIITSHPGLCYIEGMSLKTTRDLVKL